MKLIILSVLIFILSGCTGYSTYKEPIPVTINQDKVINEKKLEVYNNIVKEYEHVLFDYADENSNYKADIEETFGIPFSEGNKIESTGNHGLYFTVADVPLSETKIPDTLESLGLTGIKEFIENPENNRTNSSLFYGIEGIVTPGKTYETDDMIMKNVSSYAKNDNDIIVRLKYTKKVDRFIDGNLLISFGNVFSVPAQYEQLTAAITDDENLLNNYFVGGKTDQLIFMNSKYSDYSTYNGLSYEFYDILMNNKAGGTPIKCILYGNNGEIDKIRIMIVKPEGLNFEVQNADSCQKYLSAVNLSDEGEDRLINSVKQFIDEKLPSEKGNLENYNYHISQYIGGGFSIPQGSKIVELVVEKNK